MTIPATTLPTFATGGQTAGLSPLAGATTGNQANGNAGGENIGNLFSALLAMFGVATSDVEGGLGLEAKTTTKPTPENLVAGLISLLGDDAKPEDLLKALNAGEDDQAGFEGLADILKQLSELAEQLNSGAALPADAVETVAALVDKLAPIVETFVQRATANANGQPAALPKQLADALVTLDKIVEALPASDRTDQLASKLAELKPASATTNSASAERTAAATFSLNLDAQSKGKAQPDIALPETLKAAPGADPLTADTKQANSGDRFERPAQQIAQQPQGHAAAMAANAARDANIDSEFPADPLLMAQTNASGRIEGNPQIKMASAPFQGATPNLNLPHVAFEMVRHIRNGASRFEIMLDPPEMGRIDVRLDIDNKGNLNARLAVERPETLDLLQRDARALERALTQAGLDTGRTNLEFSLKQNPFTRQDGGQHQDDETFNLADADESDAVAAPSAMATATTYYRGIASPGGVNMLA